MIKHAIMIDYLRKTKRKVNTCITSQSARETYATKALCKIYITREARSNML